MHLLRQSPLLTAIVLLVCCSTSNIPMERVERMRLTTPAGVEVQVGNTMGEHATLFLILSPDCPMCQNYAGMLAGFPAIDSIQAIGIFPTEFIPADSVISFRDLYNIRMPMLMDPDAELAQMLGAEVTPTAFLISANGDLLYRGAIDNWATRPGRKKVKATEHYLMDALNAVRIGQRPKVENVPAMGCIIEYEL